MATLAICEIFAESHFVVVTGRAARAGFRRFVHGDRRHVHFAARSRMTIIAFEEAVFRVAEIAGNEGAWRRDVVFAVDLMALETFAARKSAAAFHRRMALKTGFMRRFAVRNGKADAAAARLVTGRAIFLRVVGVVEFDAETARIRHFRVAFAAIRKIFRAESSLIIMAGRAAVCLARVHPDFNLRAARAVAIDAVRRSVFRMTEIKTDVGRRYSKTIRRAEFVTGRTRTDVFIADDFIRCVTLKTGFVRRGA